MSATSLPLRRAATRVLGRRARLERLRVELPGGAHTTLHVASYDRAAFQPRLVVLEQPTPLARWSRENRVRHALVGGFFARPEYRPLGELRLDSSPAPSIPFDPRWAEVRASVQIDGPEIVIARRNELDAEPLGDLLQAGPLLVRDGRNAMHDDGDLEGFSAGAHQFDSDITDGRYPRAALGVDDDRILAVACDGRTEQDAGMTLSELAAAMIALGASEALNLDGGGSASLVHGGRLRNRPREEHGVDLLGGRPIVTALVFEPR